MDAATHAASATAHGALAPSALGVRGQPSHTVDLATKIARLVEERGWNQEDFARHADLNRQTVRQILQPSGDRRLRNATVAACARALNLSVSELRHWPLDRLLQRVSPPVAAAVEASALHRLYEQATQPELMAWLERNRDRAEHLSALEIDELLSIQGTGGPLTSLGVEHHVKQIERKRRLLEQVHTIAGTEYIDLLEKFVELIYEKVQPYRDRA
jgi:transcriptional regulator with XRE-family HTH domain